MGFPIPCYVPFTFQVWVLNFLILSSPPVALIALSMMPAGPASSARSEPARTRTNRLANARTRLVRIPYLQGSEWNRTLGIDVRAAARSCMNRSEERRVGKECRLLGAG